MTSPNMLHIPAGVGLGNGSSIVQQYLAYIWYHTQIILNPGNGQESQHTPVDFPYVFGFIKDITNAAGTPNAQLQMAWLVKGLQEETANGLGPDQGSNGWQWQFSDPEDTVDQNWNAIWSATTPTDRTNLTTAYVQAWLNQASTYTRQQFITGGWVTAGEDPSTLNPNTTFGGAMWWMLPRLRYYGVSSTTINQYYSWVATIWPTANWSFNKSATCWAVSNGAACQTD